MRKKYLSALLFGALLFASAGTFTSCKDYDDDIDGLRTEITDLKSAIEELQAKIGDGKFVTNVAANGQGLTITWNDGNSTTIENVINEATGETEAGDVITFDDATGEILVNGEGSGYYAAKNPETGAIKVPYVNNDGALVLINEEGEEVVTNILTAPVTAVENTDGSVTLTIRANGSSQQVVIPSAASSVTDLDLVGYDKNAAKDAVSGASFPTGEENGFISINKGYVTAHVYKRTSATSGWKGNKPNLKANDILAAYKMNGLVSRIAPLSVDASDIEFQLVDTKKSEAPLTISMSPFSNNAVLTRAASKNGLYSVAFEYELVNSTKSVQDWVDDTFGAADASKLFALTTESGLISDFDIAIMYDSDAQSITNFYLNEIKTANDVTTTTTPKEIEVGKTYTIVTNDDSFIYDAYLTFDDNDIDKWGIEYDKAKNPLSFTVTKLPDNLSTKDFTFGYNYMTKDGTIHQGTSSKQITVVPRTNLDAATQLCSEYTHPIVDNTNNANSFVVSLDEMFKSLGESKTLQWIRDVDLTTGNVKFEIKEGNDKAPNNGQADASISFTEADGKTATTDASKAKYVKFTFANNDNHLTPGTSYVATITFAPKSTAQGEYANDVINKATVPLKITIPAFTDLLQKDMGVFDEKGEVASAYMLEGYTQIGNTGVYTTTYKFNGAFMNLADNTKKGFEFKLTLDNDSNKPVVGTQTSADVAWLGDAYDADNTGSNSVTIDKTNANTVGITLLNATKDDAYGKELIVNLTKAKYCGVYEYDNTSFKIKLLSPIKEGKFVANGGAVSIAATGTTVVTAEDVWATTANDEVKYDLFKTAIKQTDGTYNGKDWYRQDVANVTFSSDRIKFIVENANGTPTEAVVDPTTGAIKEASSISLRSVGNKGDRDKLKIAVTDIWGYTLEDEVDVVVE